MTDLPLLGVALPTSALETMQDFILSENRDLELQDFFDADLLNGDWKPVADRARALLSGHAGRLGIHGPFWGLSIASPDPDMRAKRVSGWARNAASTSPISGTRRMAGASRSLRVVAR